MTWSERRARRRERRASDRAQERWSGPKTAFVLSGGGVLGAVQVGQLRALLEASIVPDMVVGSSVGALNGALVAHDPRPEAMYRLTEIWRGLKTEDLFPGSRVARVWNILARGDHVHSNEGLRRLIEKLPVHTFADMQLPFHVCATNLATGREAWFDSGPLARAVLASTALPGIYPPVSIDGELYVDGGVVNNVPISRAVELGASKIYVLTCGTAPTKIRPIRMPIDVLVQSFAHARTVRVDLDIERYRNDAELIMLPTFDTGDIAYNDPSRSAELIERAHEATRRFLAKPDEAHA